MPTTILDGETYEEARYRRFSEEAEEIEKMTQDEIIRMAREAGFDIGGDGIHAYHPDTGDEKPLDEYLERFAALVAAHERERAWTEKDWDEAAEWIRQQEREACAKVCEAECIGFANDDEQLNRITAAIRARK